MMHVFTLEKYADASNAIEAVLEMAENLGTDEEIGFEIGRRGKKTQISCHNEISELALASYLMGAHVSFKAEIPTDPDWVGK